MNKVYTNVAPHCRQAIVTKYHGPTNSRGSRITAKADAGRVTVEWDYELGVEENHQRAAVALALKLGWPTEMIGAGLPGSMGGYVWSQIPDEYHQAVLAVFETRLAMARGENNGNPHCRAYGKAVDALTGCSEHKEQGPFAICYREWEAQQDAEV